MNGARFRVQLMTVWEIFIRQVYAVHSGCQNSFAKKFVRPRGVVRLPELIWEDILLGGILLNIAPLFPLEQVPPFYQLHVCR